MHSALPLTVKIIDRRLETPAIVALNLADPYGRPLPPYGAGAHIDVALPGGLIRQFSLLSRDIRSDSACAGSVYRIAVLKEPASRGGSRAMHALAVGDCVGISEPRNTFPLAAGAPRSVLLAGGIGITPLLCMAETLHHEGGEFQLHYCARSRGEAAFLDTLAAGGYAGRVALHFDDGPAEQRLDVRALLSGLGSSTHLYVCGPAGFIGWSLDAAKALGWPAAQLHCEYFAAAPAAADPAAFTVRIASTGRSVTVAADQSLIAALKAEGIDIPRSCEAGVCGTCLTGVLDGVPDHRDFFLTDVEKARGDVMLPCCSRSKTPQLVLAL
jgi:vanillate O-demethylase ferredoxin subunit